METTPPRKLNLHGVFTDSERILTANNTRFIALSCLFLPLCFYLITTPIFHLFLFSQLLTVDHFHAFPHKSWGNIRRILMLDQNHQNSVVSYIFYILIVYLLSLCAISAITYTTHHGFSGKPVNFFTAIKSLTSTFFPIVTTAFTAHSLIFLFFLTFVLFVQTNLMLVQNLGFVIDYNSSNFIWFSNITGAILMAIVTYFLVNWSLAFVVVVVESKFGLSALRRSACLVKGTRLVSLVLFLYYGFFLGISAWVMEDCLHAFSDWQYVLFAMMAGCGLLMSYMQQWIAATSVLYNYCVVFHGESVVGGLSSDYFDLAQVRNPDP